MYLANEQFIKDFGILYEINLGTNPTESTLMISNLKKTLLSVSGLGKIFNHFR